MSDERVDVSFGAQIAGLLTGMGEATTAVTEATETMSASLEALTAIAEAVVAPFLAIAAVVGGGGIFKEVVESTVELGTQLEVMNQKTGISVEELSALQFAAKESHVSTEELSTGMQRLSRGMEEAAKGTGPANDALKALGINATDSSGHLRSVDDVLLDVAGKFASMEDGAGKTALAMDLFGRSGANLIPLLNQGAGGISALKSEADQLGATMGERDVEATKKYHQEITVLDTLLSSIGRNIALVVIPIFTKLAEWINNALEALNKLAIKLKVAMPDLTSPLDNDPDLVHRLGLDHKTPPPPPDQKDLMQRLEAQWLQIKEMNKENFGALAQLELDFWKSKLSLADKGSKDYLDIQKRIVSLETQIAQQGYEGELAALHAKEQADKDDLAQVVADRQAELEIIRKHYGEMSKEVQDGIARVNEAQTALQKQTAKQWTETFNAIPAAFSEATGQIGKSVNSLGDLFREFFTDLLKMSITTGAAILRDHVANELAKRNITAASVAERVALETWAALQSVAKSSWAALIAVGNYAAEAIAGAWAAIAGIPFVGPVLAPAVAAGVGAAVFGLAGDIRSASGGFDVPSGLNPMTQLHAQEMVLPADLANRVRGLTGDGGGDTHVHVHALDHHDVRRFVDKNRDAIADAGKKSVKNGRGRSRRG